MTKVSKLDKFNLNLIKTAAGTDSDRKYGKQAPMLRPSHSDVYLSDINALKKSAKYPR